MKFLESITAFGNDVLVPIDHIHFVKISYVMEWEIQIVADNEIDLRECFGKDEDKAYRRYEQIKNILNGKNKK